MHSEGVWTRIYQKLCFRLFNFTLVKRSGASNATISIKHAYLISTSRTPPKSLFQLNRYLRCLVVANGFLERQEDQKKTQPCTTISGRRILDQTESCQSPMPKPKTSKKAQSMVDSAQVEAQDGHLDSANVYTCFSLAHISQAHPLFSSGSSRPLSVHLHLHLLKPTRNP